MKSGKGYSNGTFGELVQGVIDDRPFLITLPIPSLRSEAVFIPDQTLSEITGLQENMKTLQACKKLCHRFSVKGGGRLQLRSNIPSGKGMASSSADITAAMKAIADSYSLPLTAELISGIAVEIEPTDGVMYDEVVAYDYIHGKLIESFGWMPPFSIISIDFGGGIDTIQFNQLEKNYSWQEQCDFEEAYHLVKEGIRKQDLSLICSATGISARINQKVLPKPYFYELEDLALAYGGGLVTAHSGTVLGIIMDKNVPHIKEIIRQISVIAKSDNIKLFSC